MKLSATGVLALAAIAGAGLYVLVKKPTIAGFAQDAGAAVVDAAVNAVDGVVSGATYTVADALGVPRTSKTACEIAKAGGLALDVATACPAQDYFSWLWNGRK